MCCTVQTNTLTNGNKDSIVSKQSSSLARTNANNLQITFYLARAVILAFLYLVGDAILDAHFMVLGHLALARFLPQVLDPSGSIFQSAPLDATYEVARHGTWIVGIPPLLASITAIAFTLEDCATTQSHEPAERWLALRTAHVAPALGFVAGNAWAAVAGPFGVWMNAIASLPGSEQRGLDAWHAAFAMLAGRGLKTLCQLILRRWFERRGAKIYVNEVRGCSEDAMEKGSTTAGLDVGENCMAHIP